MRLADQGVDIAFAADSQWVGLPNGENLLWVEEASPVVDFWLVLAWLSWVARGCPVRRVAFIDRENGIITIEAMA